MIFPPSNVILPGHLLLLTDQLASPADFLLHQVLCERLRNSNASGVKGHTIVDNKVVILTAMGAEGGGRWKAVASKSGVNLAVFNKSVTFIDILAHSESSTTPSVGNAPPLKGVYDALSSNLAPQQQQEPQKDSETLVILDDISVLEWIGIASSKDVLQFARALTALCRKASASLIIRHHILSSPSGDPTFIDDPESDALLPLLIQLCSYHLDVRSLSSGRSGSVSGEIALHYGPSNFRTAGPDQGTVKPIPRSCAMQYRLLDHSAVYFERGTGGGVL